METSNESHKTTKKPAKNKRKFHIAKNSRMAWTEKDHIRKIKPQFMKNIISGNLAGVDREGVLSVKGKEQKERLCWEPTG